jgi:pSer/pThr/pTyr-binding forkhead associated (FHA) protein
MWARLLPLNSGAAVDIVKDMTLVGRKDECDLRLDHKSISKLHCVIVKTDGLLILRDLGSTNGTRVNGQRVRRAALLPNDLISFANFKYRVTFGPDAQLGEPGPEHTQHLDQKELEERLAKGLTAREDPSSAELPVLPVQVNPLPDVYPDHGDVRR